MRYENSLGGGMCRGYVMIMIMLIIIAGLYDGGWVKDCELRLEEGRKCINDYVYVWFCEVGALVWLGENVLGCP